MSNLSSQLNTVLSAEFFSPKPGTKGPQNGVDLLKRAKFVGQNTKLWRDDQMYISITLQEQLDIMILPPSLFASSPNWAHSPPMARNCQVAFGKTMEGEERMNFLRCTVFFQISVFPGCSCGGGEMIKRCGGKARESRQWSEHPLLHLVSLSVSNPPTPVTLAIT